MFWKVFGAFASAAVRIRVEGIKRSKNSSLGTEADEYNSQHNFGVVLKETMLNLGPTFIKGNADESSNCQLILLNTLYTLLVRLLDFFMLLLGHQYSL